MNLFKLFRKNISLRIVNVVGLSVVFACSLLSAGYIKQELSYDRHHANANRIVRMSLQFDNEPVDGRILGNAIDVVLQQIPEIDRTLKMHKVYTAVLTHEGKRQVVNDIYLVNRNFSQVFDIPLLQGDKNEALQQKGQLLISESFAQQLFGDANNNELLLSQILIEGRQATDTFFISGIFKNLPETSHFNTDILLHLPDEYETFAFVYLLLKESTDIKALAQKITQHIEGEELYMRAKPRVLLMPITDIHLHSHNLREMSVNGNIYYIYLVIGANLLLLIVVLFNLWLNASLIFAHNRRYYQLLRLHGAPSSAVFKDEALSALLLGVFSIAVGMSAAFYILSLEKIAVQISLFDICLSCLVFLLIIIAISLLPALKGMSSTLFLNTNKDLKPTKFSHKNVKYLITVQYAVVMIVVILAFGINKQMNLVKDTQVGGKERNILVLAEQPEQVQAKYALLKSELLKYADIKAVTACFQLPGDAIRDATSVKKEEDTEWKNLPIMVAGEDFLPFFRIKTIAGSGFSSGRHDYQSENNMLFERQAFNKYSEHTEEYIINRKALSVLGFSTPEGAIGQMLHIFHGSIDYIRKGIIVGVTDDFNYTGLYEETIPLLILQRNVFLHCIMVRINPDRFSASQAIVETVWNEVNPDYPLNYIFMNDVFNRMYRNEINAQQLVFIFSLLCFAIADLGLIIFMAFIIRRRTKEIGLRKVHGASVSEIIRMLNMDFIRHIALVFVIALPVAWYVMQQWLERFTYRTSLDWWIFALAGLLVLLVSVISVSLQSWRAATANPVDAIKIE
ncbi:MAG: ABC transporter permease [Prevotellaceae bacterium]|jgi:putative ABC transport system permease protein|nr:ABC transporter permease [Prevotellaceae bacterium]